jgi:hypothetical protein
MFLTAHIEASMHDVLGGGNGLLGITALHAHRGQHPMLLRIGLTNIQHGRLGFDVCFDGMRCHASLFVAVSHDQAHDMSNVLHLRICKDVFVVAEAGKFLVARDITAANDGLHTCTG